MLWVINGLPRPRMFCPPTVIDVTPVIMFPLSVVIPSIMPERRRYAMTLPVSGMVAIGHVVFYNQNAPNPVVQEIMFWQHLQPHPGASIAIKIVSGREVEVNTDMRVVVVLVLPGSWVGVMVRMRAGSRAHQQQ